MKKYELTSETTVVFGTTLYRIRALIDFANVKAGDLGGYIEKESNLSQNGDARVFGNAMVYGDAMVYGNAWVSGDAMVFNHISIHWVPHVGSRLDTVTFFLGSDKELYVTTGCFYGDLKRFEEKVRETHGDNKYAQEYHKAIELALLHIEIPEAIPYAED